MATISNRKDLVVQVRKRISHHRGSLDAKTEAVTQDLVDAAVLAFSRIKPRFFTHTFSGDGTTYQLALSDFASATPWVAGLSHVVGRIEHPTGSQERQKYEGRGEHPCHRPPLDASEPTRARRCAGEPGCGEGDADT